MTVLGGSFGSRNWTEISANNRIHKKEWKVYLLRVIYYCCVHAYQIKTNTTDFY